MKYYLEPKGWPSASDLVAPGLFARMRKGKILLYFKTSDGKLYDMSGAQTTVTGLLSPVILKTEGD